MSKGNMKPRKGEQKWQGRGVLIVFFNGSKGEPHWEGGRDEQRLLGVRC